MVDWDDIRYFLAAARADPIRTAAEHLATGSISCLRSPDGFWRRRPRMRGTDASGSWTARALDMVGLYPIPLWRSLSCCRD